MVRTSTSEFSGQKIGSITDAYTHSGVHYRRGTVRLSYSPWKQACCCPGCLTSSLKTDGCKHKPEMNSIQGFAFLAHSTRMCRDTQDHVNCLPQKECRQNIRLSYSCIILRVFINSGSVLHSCVIDLQKLPTLKENVSHIPFSVCNNYTYKFTFNTKQGVNLELSQLLCCLLLSHSVKY